MAEAGWGGPGHPKGRADHRAIFHVLKNRWPRMRNQHPRRFPRFLDVVQNYVAAMDPRTPKGGRVRWLLALQEHQRLDTPPTGWPEQKARWKVHRGLWEQALERAQRCLHGRGCGDPYAGRALHWGGAMDKPKGCMVELPNVGTNNTFYGIDPECQRRRRR